MVRKARMKMDLADILFNVRYIDEVGQETPNQTVLWKFEDAVAQFLTKGKGVRWELRRVGKSPVAATSVLKEKLKGPIVGTLPSYAEMEKNTLYRSITPSFSFCDMVYKNGEGTLVCIQVSWDPHREVKAGAVREFCHAVGLCDNKDGPFTVNEAQRAKENVLLVLCPRPRLSSKATLSFEEDCVLRGGDIVRMGQGFTSWINEDGDSS